MEGETSASVIKSGYSLSTRRRNEFRLERVNYYKTVREPLSSIKVGPERWWKTNGRTQASAVARDSNVIDAWFRLQRGYPMRRFASKDAGPFIP